MEGYYDYFPKVIPERPIAITGFVGARVPLVGAAISALTGLRFAELDRLIEHQAGASIPLIVLSKSEAALRRHESKTLKQALQAKPPGILVIGEGTLLNRGNRRLIKKQAKLVYVELSVFELYTGLRQELADSPGKYLHLFPTPPEHPQDLQSLLTARTPSYHQADLIISGSRKHPTQISQEIIAKLNL